MRKGNLFLVLLLLSFISFAQTIPPTNLKAIIVDLNYTINKGVSLTWDYTAVTVLVNFNVYRKAGIDATTTPFFKIATTNQSSYIDTKVESGMTYTYFVTSVINNIESGPSNKVQITIPPLPIVGFGKICGHVYDDYTKAPIANGIVVFYFGTSASPSVTSTVLPGVITNINGNFSATLQPGNYYLYTSARGYIGEFYNNVKIIQNATKITLNAKDSLFLSIGLRKAISIVSLGGGGKNIIIDSSSNEPVNGGFYLSQSNTKETDKGATMIDGYELYQNYPNPFNPSTKISYQIPSNNFVSLKVYNILGKEEATLVNEEQSAGRYNLNFRANNLASGVYFYKLTAGNYISVKRFILLK